ncbi:MAG TPA: dihydrolipoyl dehydrogenase [Pirellulales bacterium]|nr:dihydrolipoyl dehydrogenase [Pirellulales bacterium]
MHDLIVIGGGPGGYTAAIRASQLGLNVAVVELESILGGTCLRVGCIPSKAMLESSERFYETKHALAQHGVKVGSVDFDLQTMLRRKEQIVSTNGRGIDGLFKKHKITRCSGTGRIVAPGKVAVETKDQDATELTAKHILIATGSKPATLPGIELDGDRIGTSTEALSYPAVPKHLVVVGGGYIGLELGSVWNRLGAKVTVLEFLDRIFPGTDSEIARDAFGLLQKQGIEFRLGSRVVAARAEQEGCVVQCEGAEPLKCDRVLVAVGRVPYTEGLGLESVGIRTDAKGRIPVNDHFETTAAGIYAIGDCIPGPMLAHKAEEEGVACVERIVTGYGHVNYDAIPAVIFTQPEIAAVGKTEDELLAAKVAYRKGIFPFRANGRARTLGQTDGKVKILADQKTDRILGAHILGPRAGDLIAEATAAITFGASAEDLARTCHAHPTLPEAIKEAALAVDGRAINL